MLRRKYMCKSLQSGPKWRFTNGWLMSSNQPHQQQTHSSDFIKTANVCASKNTSKREKVRLGHGWMGAHLPDMPQALIWSAGPQRFQLKNKGGVVEVDQQSRHWLFLLKPRFCCSQCPHCGSWPSVSPDLGSLTLFYLCGHHMNVVPMNTWGKTLTHIT